MNPALVIPPVGPVVQLAELKQFLRVTHSAEDMLIASLEVAAVAHLDGWAGILCRCILPQTWSTFLPAGSHTLPFPDVTSAQLEVDGETVDLELQRFGSGARIELCQPATVTFSCAMPEHLLPSVRVAVMMWVAEVYGGREASAAGSGEVYKALVRALRWCAP